MTGVVTRKPQTNTSTQPSENKSPAPDAVYEEREIEPKDVDEYLALHKQPYLSSYLSLGEAWKLQSIKTGAEFVDTFIRSEMSERHLDNSFKAYKSVLSELEKSMGLNSLERGDYKLEKMKRWIEMVLIPQRKLDQTRKLILGT